MPYASSSEGETSNSRRGTGWLVENVAPNLHAVR
jgi:hypothetical protein